MDKRTVIWVLSDGKTGHEAQSIGLATAVAERVNARVRVIRLAPGSFLRALRTKPPAIDALGPPDVVIGAGTRTHASLRACQRVFDANAVVLMRPARGTYDLIVAPAHDALRPRANVVETRGALNRVRPSAHKNETAGLILIGGPSKHHGWDDGATAAQVQTVLERTPKVRWTLTTSRRTPRSFVATLERTLTGTPARIEIHEAERTTREWLLARYAESARAWVSEDSVSMVYEALTSGARVGLLSVPRIGGAGRVVRGVDALAREGFVTRFEEWERSGFDLRAAPEQLDEATRVARIVVERFGLGERDDG